MWTTADTKAGLRRQPAFAETSRSAGQPEKARDASKVHTGAARKKMTTLRGFTINQLRTAGHTNIAA